MWVNVNTLGTFTLHADIRYECWKSGIELPGVLTNEVLAQYGYMPVVQVLPEYDPITQGLSDQPCVNNNGVWEQHFVPYQLDPIIVANNCQMLLEIPESARPILQAAGRLEAAEAAAAARAALLRKSQIIHELTALDTKSIRALREGNQARIDELEAQAQVLRTELAAL